MTDQYAHLDPDDARQHREQDARQQRMLKALEKTIAAEKVAARDARRQAVEQDARHPLDRQSEQRMLEALKEDITFGNPPAKAKYESLTGKWVYIPAFDDPTVVELLAIINRLTSQTRRDVSPADQTPAKETT